MIVLIIISAALYALLLFWKRDGVWLLLSLSFVISSGLLRYLIDVQSVKDFDPYYSSFLKFKYDQFPLEFLVEPYRAALFGSVQILDGFDDLGQITAVYYFHFAVITAAFLWLAWLREVSFEVKLILFLAFYPTIAFIWLRAGMAFSVAAFLYFYITNGKWRIFHVLPLAMHASTVPFLLVNSVKKLNFLKKTLILLAFLVIIYFIQQTHYVQYAVYKLERYSDTASQRTSSNLLLFHIGNIFVFLYLALINSKLRKNFTVLALTGIYVLMYAVNPVSGLRMFPFVLIAVIVERITFPHYKLLSLVIIIGAYFPVYLARFNQIFL